MGFGHAKILWDLGISPCWISSDRERVREVGSRNQMDKVFTALPLVCFGF